MYIDLREGSNTERIRDLQEKTFSGFISAEYESGEESSCLNGYKVG